MIVADTSALIEAFSGRRGAADALRALIERGERIVVPSIVLYEWLRGPRRAEELALQDELFPSEEAIPFGPAEARAAAALYASIPRPRGREIDLAIAATALVRGAALWTLNRRDFDDIPALDLV
ncbi:MAG TPA: type II toxin-antitoxin system VapC family toxin [Thermoanaerobaculia bacterium]